MNNLICPICNSASTKLFLEAKDYMVFKGNSELFSIYDCSNCKNGFSYPFLTNDELTKYYPDDYDCYKSHKSITGYIQKLKSGNDIKIIRKILKSSGKKILEIGAGSGLFLYLLKNESFEVYGIEPSISGLKYAKDNFGIELENFYFEDYEPSQKFDMIIAYHVLEHFIDPVSALKKMKTCLNEKGFLYLKLPRFDSWPARVYKSFWHGYDLPRHRVHFSKEGLIDLLKENDMEIVLFKGDYGPLDTIRAIKYYSQFSKNIPLKLFFKIINSVPNIIKLLLAVILEILMSPFKSGRMSIIARKIN